ncbi:hypothetical protein BDK51DRAFT_50382 [Blyttiomyces helicus]|uniref:Proliferating cell nuclear antigen PCNA C-terminal domain-containing protein n=1 Tax=Blyttiomyces helicus TaxID=388810 RepID=A0A4P9VTY4_9FUNG|nr:hypothetical protein BDK51DRAFT_50382 [Blyttiomyces helicus]|eukprot:RKO83004.1 hypothetical protein BDK51DRAFT_50382 [Blyttiomyces helicus]
MVSFEATKIQIESTAKELNDQSNIEYQPAKGVFDLKFLKSFAKAANLSPDVIIYLTNYSPIICEYSISGLGTLRYLLSREEGYDDYDDDEYEEDDGESCDMDDEYDEK